MDEETDYHGYPLGQLEGFFVESGEWKIDKTRVTKRDPEDPPESMETSAINNLRKEEYDVWSKLLAGLRPRHGSREVHVYCPSGQLNGFMVSLGTWSRSQPDDPAPSFIDSTTEIYDLTLEEYEVLERIIGGYRLN